MGVNIDFSLLGKAPDIGASFQQGMQQGRALRMQRDRDGALAAYGQNPNDPRAMATLWQADPALAAQLETLNQKRSEFTRAGEERNALTDFFVARNSPGQPGALPTRPTTSNALSGLAEPSSPVPQPVNALSALTPAPAQLPMSVGQPSLLGGGMMESDNAQGGAVPAPVMSAPVMPGATAPARVRDSRADDALMRLARQNPETAFKVQAEELKTDKARFELAETRLDLIGRLAGSANDQASYTAALQRGAAMGIDVSTLPQEFDPAAVDAIRMQALDGKEQLAAARADRKLDWDIDDDELDNERDDRNVGSQIETRQGQLANTRRGQDLSDARGRRGQDLSDARGRRGQDLTDSRGRRGQDVTDARGRRGQDIGDKRGRESASFRGTGGRGRRGGGGAGTSGARIVNPQTGKAMVLRNGQWVPES